MKTKINDIKKEKLFETKYQLNKEGANEESLFLKSFDENIIQQIFMNLFYTYNSSEKDTFLEINDNFEIVCKLFYKISKQNLFNFNFDNINLNMPYDIYLRLKYIKSKFVISNIDEFLLKSCEEGFYNLIDILIKNNANINCFIKFDSPLIVAISNNKIKSIQKLVEYSNLDLNLRHSSGNTALILACYSGYRNIVSLLISRTDIDLNFQNDNGHTALILACEEEHIDIVSELVFLEDINLNLKDSFGWTALMCACYTGDYNMVSLLISKEHLDLNLQDNDGTSALIEACDEGYTDIVTLLISKEDIDLSLSNTDNKTALDVAKEKNHLDIIQILEKKLKIKNIKKNHEY